MICCRLGITNPSLAPQRSKERKRDRSYTLLEGNCNFSQEYASWHQFRALLVVKFYFTAFCGAILIFRRAPIRGERKSLLLRVVLFVNVLERPLLGSSRIFLMLDNWTRLPVAVEQHIRRNMARSQQRRRTVLSFCVLMTNCCRWAISISGFGGGRRMSFAQLQQRRTLWGLIARHLISLARIKPPLRIQLCEKIARVRFNLREWNLCGEHSEGGNPKIKFYGANYGGTSDALKSKQNKLYLELWEWRDLKI